MALGMNDTFWMKKSPFYFGIVPCDIVSNAIIVVGMFAAKSPPTLSIFNCSTTTGTRGATVNIHDYFEEGARYLKYNPYETAVSENIGFVPVATFEAWKKAR